MALYYEEFHHFRTAVEQLQVSVEYESVYGEPFRAMFRPDRWGDTMISAIVAM
jgi:hypothetical protein